MLKDKENGIRFVCSACRCKPAPNAAGAQAQGTSNNNLDSAAVGQLYEMVRTLSQNYTVLAKQMSDMTAQISLLLTRQNSQPDNGQRAPFGREDLQAEIREFEERKKRVNSMIVRGISARTDSEFKSHFERVCTFLINQQPSVEIFCINRDQCMYRVKFVDRDIKNALLTNARKLKDDAQFNNIFLSRDLAFLQRQEIAARRASGASHRGRSGWNTDTVLPPSTNSTPTSGVQAGQVRQHSAISDPSANASQANMSMVLGSPATQSSFQ